MKTVKLKDGTAIPQLGQGTWTMGDDSSKREQEIDALRYGIEHGLTLLDTAEMYGEGKAEKLLGEAMAPYDRRKLFVVSKVYPWHAGRDHIFTSCEQSLKRLKTDYLDLYLLHWCGNIPFEETVQCMEELVQKGLIRHWGVSNLDTEDMKALMAAGGKNCVTDQVLYHIGSRGVEYDLLPWLKKNRMPMMAYCPLAHTAEKRRKIEAHPIIGEMAERHHVSKAGIMLGFVMQDPMVFTVCKASSIEHVRENCQAAELVFSEAEMKDLDREFAPPHEKVPLDME